MTWNRVKWIAMISMFIDHFVKAFPVQMLLITYLGMEMIPSARIIDLMSVIGRIAFPIYAYGIAQGCWYSRNPKKFLTRLFVFAMISEVPYNLALHSGAFTFGVNNVFFTLLLGALSCYICKYFKEISKAWISIFPILLLVAVAEIGSCDYGGFGVIFIVVSYVFFLNKKLSVLSLGLANAAFYLFYASFNGRSFTWLENGNLGWLRNISGVLLGLLILAAYNGHKGKANKWLFYVFYPFHLILLYAISLLIT